ncbi:hypothetical protein [Dyadobacter sp. CY326]|uniref:hypothetical protein n=1 Tax=Dyadobacter sp. CY326 TaxID=2907300 RepID=UPI001F3F35FA|nr:hypothetical protein [Dyadobacter sp. CY326]MCE7067942.1 hypothetical protein [Dyadobacter sp. CY326]
MQELLDLPDLKDSNYVSIVDPDIQYALEKSENVPRQRIRNNLPGTSNFCPLIFKSARLESYIDDDLEQRTHSILQKTQKDILYRTSAFLLLKDSKASFTIEGESPSHIRATNWGKAIGQAGSKGLTAGEVLRLQELVIGDNSRIPMGFRIKMDLWVEHDKATGTADFTDTSFITC